MALHGYLDTILSSGLVEGWAYDDEAPLRPLTIAVRNGGTEVARGVANLFRGDLVDAKCGTGWCAFRARLTVEVREALGMQLAMMDTDSGHIFQPPKPLPLREEPEPSITTIQDVMLHDPTMIDGIERLRGCTGVLMEYTGRFGVERFVRAAFGYVLSRGASAEEVERLSGLVRQGRLEPFGLLRALAEGEEFRRVPRQLAAPGAAAFPFQTV